MASFSLRAPRNVRCAVVRSAMAVSCALAAAGASAQGKAHVHGDLKLDVALEEAGTLTIAIEAPLDSLLAFEHRPRTAAQRQAAEAMLKQMRDVQTLIRPDASAQCSLNPGDTRVESEALQAAPAVKEQEHSELQAHYTFTCRQPGRLESIEIGLFDAFKRIRRIEARIALGKGQSKQTLKRPQKVLQIKR